MSTASAIPIPSAPPEPPSPITVVTIGVWSADISRRFRAIASETPRSSLSRPGIRSRRVDEREDRLVELLGQLHDPECLAIALRARHPEIAPDLLLRVATLLVADHRHGASAQEPETRHDRGVVGEGAVAAPLHEIADQDAHVVEGERAVWMPRDERLLPGRQVLVDLAGELLELSFELLRPPGPGPGVGEALQLLEPPPHALERLLEPGLVRHAETVAEGSFRRSTPAAFRGRVRGRDS